MDDFLPSEVARLVLGYLKEVNCLKSWETFMEENPSLEEYYLLYKNGKVYCTNVEEKSLMEILSLYRCLKRYGDKIIDEIKRCEREYNSNPDMSKCIIEEIASMVSSIFQKYFTLGIGGTMSLSASDLTMDFVPFDVQSSIFVDSKHTSTFGNDLIKDVSQIDSVETKASSVTPESTNRTYQMPFISEVYSLSDTNNNNQSSFNFTDSNNSKKNSEESSLKTFLIDSPSDKYLEKHNISNVKIGDSNLKNVSPAVKIENQIDYVSSIESSKESFDNHVSGKCNSDLIPIICADVEAKNVSVNEIPQRQTLENDEILAESVFSNNHDIKNSSRRILNLSTKNHSIQSLEDKESSFNNLNAGIKDDNNLELNHVLASSNQVIATETSGNENKLDPIQNETVFVSNTYQFPILSSMPTYILSGNILMPNTAQCHVISSVNELSSSVSSISSNSIQNTDFVTIDPLKSGENILAPPNAILENVLASSDRQPEKKSTSAGKKDSMDKAESSIKNSQKNKKNKRIKKDKCILAVLNKHCSSKHHFKKEIVKEKPARKRAMQIEKYPFTSNVALNALQLLSVLTNEDNNKSVQATENKVKNESQVMKSENENSNNHDKSKENGIHSPCRKKKSLKSNNKLNSSLHENEGNSANDFVLRKNKSKHKSLESKCSNSHLPHKVDVKNQNNGNKMKQKKSTDVQVYDKNKKIATEMKAVRNSNEKNSKKIKNKKQSNIQNILPKTIEKITLNKNDASRKKKDYITQQTDLPKKMIKSEKSESVSADYKETLSSNTSMREIAVYSIKQNTKNSRSKIISSDDNDISETFNLYGKLKFYCRSKSSNITKQNVDNKDFNCNLPSCLSSVPSLDIQPSETLNYQKKESSQEEAQNSNILSHSAPFKFPNCEENLPKKISLQEISVYSTKENTENSKSGKVSSIRENKSYKCNKVKSMKTINKHGRSRSADIPKEKIDNRKFNFSLSSASLHENQLFETLNYEKDSSRKETQNCNIMSHCSFESSLNDKKSARVAPANSADMFLHNENDMDKWCVISGSNSEIFSSLTQAVVQNLEKNCPALNYDEKNSKFENLTPILNIKKENNMSDTKKDTISSSQNAIIRPKKIKLSKCNKMKNINSASLSNELIITPVNACKSSRNINTSLPDELIITPVDACKSSKALSFHDIPESLSVPVNEYGKVSEKYNASENISNDINQDTVHNNIGRKRKMDSSCNVSNKFASKTIQFSNCDYSKKIKKQNCDKLFLSPDSGFSEMSNDYVCNNTCKSNKIHAKVQKTSNKKGNIQQVFFSKNTLKQYSIEKNILHSDNTDIYTDSKLKNPPCVRLIKLQEHEINSLIHKLNHKIEEKNTDNKSERNVKSFAEANVKLVSQSSNESLLANKDNNTNNLEQITEGNVKMLFQNSELVLPEEKNSDCKNSFKQITKTVSEETVKMRSQSSNELFSLNKEDTDSRNNFEQMTVSEGGVKILSKNSNELILPNRKTIDHKNNSDEITKTISEEIVKMFSPNSNESVLSNKRNADFKNNLEQITNAASEDDVKMLSQNSNELVLSNENNSDLKNNVEESTKTISEENAKILSQDPEESASSYKRNCDWKNNFQQTSKTVSEKNVKMFSESSNKSALLSGKNTDSKTNLEQTSKIFSDENVKILSQKSSESIMSYSLKVSIQNFNNICDSNLKSIAASNLEMCDEKSEVSLAFTSCEKQLVISESNNNCYSPKDVCATDTVSDSDLMSLDDKRIPKSSIASSEKEVNTDSKTQSQWEIIQGIIEKYGCDYILDKINDYLNC